MKHNIGRTAVAALLGLAMAGCQGLDVANLNAPDRFRALSNPKDVETLIYSAYRLWWTSAHHSEPSRAYSVMGNETTSALTGSAVFDLVSEPRTFIPNTVTYAGNWVMRRPWDQRWQVISNAIDGIKAIEENELVITEGTGADRVDVTVRAKAFAHFLAGLGHTYLAYHFDKSYVFTPDMTLAEDLDFKDMGSAGFDFKPYPEVAEAGRELIEQSIEMMAESPRGIPASWTSSEDLSVEDFTRIAHSFIARSLVYTARTPEERAAVDWTQVLYHLDRGIQKDLYANYLLDVWTSPYKEFTQFLNDSRAHNRLVGPADTSGAYQTWLETPVEQRVRFQVRTPDRRITGNTATTAGSLFAYRSASMSSVSTRGQYLNSYYGSNKLGGQVASRSIPMVTMSVLEMDFLRAEAYYRLGRRDDAAAIVNVTRTASRRIGTVTHAGLPAVTAAGVPQSTRCVPRKPFRNADGTVPCGDLWDALMYEKRIELHAQEALIPFADARGWGQLVEGTPLHFAIPARELEALGLPEYSFGGAGREGSAPPPTTTSP